MITISFLQSQIYFKVAPTQVDKIRLGIDLKVDGIDARGIGVDGHHARTQHTDISRRDGEQVQHHSRIAGELERLRLSAGCLSSA